MRRLLPFALVLAACAPTGQSEPRQPGIGTTESKPSSPKTPQNPVPPPVAGNPNRVYQLDTLRKTDLDVKGNPVHAWIMDTDAKQMEGMMFLEDGDVKADEGMLFVFDGPQPVSNPDGKPRGFWMENTLIPLDIVYISPKGKVVSIGKGRRLDTTTVPAGGEFQYVLELKAGTAARYGLKTGDTLKIPKL